MYSIKPVTAGVSVYSVKLVTTREKVYKVKPMRAGVSVYSVKAV